MILDFYKVLMLLGEIVLIENWVIDDWGIFGLILINCICVDLLIKLLVVCKCDYWEMRFFDNDKWFIWLVEYVFGDINNNI